MANIASARKRARQDITRRSHNMMFRSRLRTHIKNVLKAISKGDKGEAEVLYKAAVPMIDSSVSKGLIHKNKAARHKSRLNSHIKAMQA